MKARLLATVTVMAAAIALSVLTAAPAAASAARPVKVIGSGAVVGGTGSHCCSSVSYAGDLRGSLGSGAYTLDVDRVCSYAQLPESESTCTSAFTAVLTLNGGTLEVASGTIDAPEAISSYPFTVVGGTGRFAGSTGSGTAELSGSYPHSLELTGTIEMAARDAQTR